MRNIRLVLASFLLVGACAPAQPDLSLQIADWCDAFGKTCGRRACRWSENQQSGGIYMVQVFRCDVEDADHNVHALTCNGSCTLARGVMQ